MKVFRFYISLVLSAALAFPASTFAATSDVEATKIALKDVGIKSNKDRKKFKAVYSKMRPSFPPETQKWLDQVALKWGDHKMPPMQSQVIKGSHGQEILRLTFNEPGSAPVVMEFDPSSEKNPLRINGKNLPPSVFSSEKEFMKYIDSNSAPDRSETHTSMIPSYELFTKMRPADRALYFINLRLTLEAADKVMQKSRGKKSSASRSGATEKFLQIFNALMGNPADASDPGREILIDACTRAVNSRDYHHNSDGRSMFCSEERSRIEVFARTTNYQSYINAARTDYVTEHAYKDACRAAGGGDFCRTGVGSRNFILDTAGPAARTDFQNRYRTLNNQVAPAISTTSVAASALAVGINAQTQAANANREQQQQQRVQRQQEQQQERRNDDSAKAVCRAHGGGDFCRNSTAAYNYISGNSDWMAEYNRQRNPAPAAPPAANAPAPRPQASAPQAAPTVSEVVVTGRPTARSGQRRDGRRNGGAPARSGRRGGAPASSASRGGAAPAAPAAGGGGTPSAANAGGQEALTGDVTAPPTDGAAVADRAGGQNQRPVRTDGAPPPPPAANGCLVAGFIGDFNGTTCSKRTDMSGLQNYNVSQNGQRLLEAQANCSSSQTACNPLLYGMSNGRPLCVASSGNTTASCSENSPINRNNEQRDTAVLIRNLLGASGKSTTEMDQFIRDGRLVSREKYDELKNLLLNDMQNYIQVAVDHCGADSSDASCVALRARRDSIRHGLDLLEATLGAAPSTTPATNTPTSQPETMNLCTNSSGGGSPTDSGSSNCIMTSQVQDNVELQRGPEYNLEQDNGRDVAPPQDEPPVADQQPRRSFLSRALPWVLGIALVGGLFALFRGRRSSNSSGPVQNPYTSTPTSGQTTPAPVDPSGAGQ